jgi:hypothetical protein
MVLHYIRNMSTVENVAVFECDCGEKPILHEYYGNNEECTQEIFIPVKCPSCGDTNVAPSVHWSQD